MQVAARLEARPGDVVLLAAGDEPLIVSRTGASKLLETSLDFDAEEALRGPEIPLLVNFMFERLLGGHLLDEIAMADRGAGSAQVVPSERASASAVARAPAVSRIRSAIGHNHFSWPRCSCCCGNWSRSRDSGTDRTTYQSAER